MGETWKRRRARALDVLDRRPDINAHEEFLELYGDRDPELDHVVDEEGTVHFYEEVDDRDMSRASEVESYFANLNRHAGVVVEDVPKPTDVQLQDWHQVGPEDIPPPVNEPIARTAPAPSDSGPEAASQELKAKAAPKGKTREKDPDALARRVEHLDALAERHPWLDEVDANRRLSLVKSLSFAEWLFDVATGLSHKRFSDEEIGDALEDIAAKVKKGRGAGWIYFKATTTFGRFLFNIGIETVKKVTKWKTR